MVRKFFIYFVLGVAFVCMVAFFLPKKNLVYFMQEQLRTSQIIVNFDTIEEHSFSTDLKGIKLYLDKVVLLHSKEAVLNVFIVDNEIYMQDIVLGDIAQAFFPRHVEYLSFRSSLPNPFVIFFEAKGEFGHIQGDIDTLKRKISMMIVPSTLMKKNYFRTLRYFKKNSNGELRYEYSY